MKHFLFGLILFSFYATSQPVFKKRSALFIGNSYTFFNGLPQLVEQLALANGDSLIADSYAPGGYTFNNHFNDVNCLAKINSKEWDFVILQAQSQEPAFSPAQVNAQTLPYALKLDSVIKANHACSKTVFFETWGRKFGDASNCAAYPPICTYTGMQNRLKQSYKSFADLSSGIMAPAGEAFRESISQNPGLELYNADQSHPSLEGSYLSACVFYETLFQKSVVSNTFISSVNSNTATFLQTIAHEVVRDSLAIWNLGIHLPWADFTYTNTGTSTFQFQSNSGNLNLLWYFGDGSFSSGAMPSHSYSVSGNYTVSHVVQDACLKDSVSKIITAVIPVGWPETQAEVNVLLYPNPANEQVFFGNIEKLKVKVFNCTGQLIKETVVDTSLPITDLEDGLYLFQIDHKGQILHRQVMVNRH
jgi:hypothetical protein